MSLKKLFNIINIMFLFEWRRLRYYSLDYILDVSSKVVYLGLNLLFWYIIQEAGFTMEGWGLQRYRSIPCIFRIILWPGRSGLYLCFEILDVCAWRRSR